MLERDTRGRKGTAARDNRSYCCQENFVACTTAGMTLESFVNCERRDEPRCWIISDSRLSLDFPDSREVFGETAVWGNERERKRELEGGRNEEKRSEKEEKKKEGTGKERTKPKKTLKSISASPGKIRYRESRSLRERARVLK